MKKSTRIVKKLLALFLVVLMSIESFGAVVSDNDGSAFITKAEFDSLKNDFQSQIDQYNTSIDAKIDGAIASYLAGITVSNVEIIPNIYSSLNNTKEIRWYSNSAYQANGNSKTDFWYDMVLYAVQPDRYAHAKVSGSKNGKYTANVYEYNSTDADYIQEFVYIRPVIQGNATDTWPANSTSIGAELPHNFSASFKLFSGTSISSMASQKAGVAFFHGEELEASQRTVLDYVPYPCWSDANDYVYQIDKAVTDQKDGDLYLSLPGTPLSCNAADSHGKSRISTGSLRVSAKIPSQLYNNAIKIKTKIFKPFYKINNKVGKIQDGLPLCTSTKDGELTFTWHGNLEGSLYYAIGNNAESAWTLGSYESTTSGSSVGVTIYNVTMKKNETLYIKYKPTSTTDYGLLTFDDLKLTAT
ncbi:MAG: hypothetical protein J6P02_05715 [Lachnospiraceae bacterium]|nr:hypothetical protein [Lachnospiraceae bacterium]